MYTCGLICPCPSLSLVPGSAVGGKGKKKGVKWEKYRPFFSPFSPNKEPGTRLSQPLSEREAEVDLVLRQTSSLFFCKFCLKNTSQHKNNTIYIIKKAELYQNKVNSSLVSTCNCKLGYCPEGVPTVHEPYILRKSYLISLS